MGISFWLVPTEEDSERIKLVMQNRPTSPTNSSSSFPTFHPHITLATGPDAATLRAMLPSNQPTVPVRFKSVDVGDKYFMSVYVTVHSPAGSPLETLRSNLRTALGDAATIPRIPHLSLYYIDDADKDARVHTLQDLHAHCRVIGALVADSRSVMADLDGTVGLGCHTGSEPHECSSSPHILRQIECKEIWLVRCEGPADGWEVLEKFPLGKQTS